MREDLSLYLTLALCTLCSMFFFSLHPSCVKSPHTSYIVRMCGPSIIILSIESNMSQQLYLINVLLSGPEFPRSTSLVKISSSLFYRQQLLALSEAMRPHRQSWRSSYGGRHVEEEDSRGPGGRRSVTGHYSVLPSSSSSSTMSRPPTREYRYESDTREARNFRAGDVNVPRYDSGYQNWRGGEQGWERGGREDGSGRHVSEQNAYRDYDSYRGQSYAPSGWDHWNYGNNFYNNNYNHTGYDYRYNSNYGHWPSYDRTGGYSPNNSYAGASNRYPSNSGQRRDIQGDRRRGYHSSNSRFSGGGNEASRSGGPPAPPPAPDTTTPDLGSLLFRHRGNQTRFDPGRSIRNNKTTPRSSQPKSYPPNRATPMKKPGPTEEYLKISLEKSERVGRADKDIDLGVNLENLVRKLLVLDLNGTIVYRNPHKRWHERLPAPGTNTVTEAGEDAYAQFDPSKPRPLRTAFPRPYLKSFRDYLFHPSTKRWLDTMVWSSAQPHSVDDMVVKCFGDRKDELVAIWARDRLGLDQNDYGMLFLA